MRRVLLDVDGVLADFVAGYLRILERETGIRATHEQITRFDIGESLGLSKDVAAKVKRAIGTEPKLAASLTPYPEAIEGVSRLRSVADVYIVTSPWNSNPTWTHDRESWLREHFGIPSTKVVHTGAKYLCRGDFLVDDKVSAVEKWQAEHPTAQGVVWNTPHNQLDSWAGLRTNDWNVLVEAVSR